MNILNVGYSSTNYYLLADGKPRLLIDVGFPGTLPKLQHELKRTDIALADIKYLLATHYHPDHAGLVLELQQLGIKLIVLDVQQAALEAAQTDPQHAKHYAGYDASNALLIACSNSRQFLSSLGIQGEIIATPGHSDDSITLILDDGAAFTGDLTLPALAGETNATVIHQSWAAVRTHGGARIYPGHGPQYPYTPTKV